MPQHLTAFSSPYAGLQLLSGGVVLTDLSGLIVFANQAAEQVFGSSARMLEKSSVLRFIPALEPLLRMSREELSAVPIQVRAFSTQLERPLKEPLPVYVSVSLCQEIPERLAIEFLEISEQVLQAEGARSIQGAESVRQLVRNLAHEVKNPLGGIRGAAQLLAQDLSDPDQAECLGIIVGEADRLQALVDRLLAPYRSALSLSSCNIHAILEHVRMVVAAEFGAGLAIVRDYDPSAPELSCDEQRLTQVFLNLVRNAAEALRPSIGSGAQIRICTRIVHQAYVGTVRHPYALQVKVCDNGPGIPESIRERIFIPLISGRAGGTGIGLSLAQTYIQQHGGSISVVSEPGRTVFTVLLPYCREVRQ